MRKRRFRIPPHIDQQITPEVREYIVQLAEGYEKKIREPEKRIEELEARFAKLTPQNSSLPPSVQHPHAKPKPAAKNPTARGRNKEPSPAIEGTSANLFPSSGAITSKTDIRRHAASASDRWSAATPNRFAIKSSSCRRFTPPSRNIAFIG